MIGRILSLLLLTLPAPAAAIARTEDATAVTVTTGFPADVPVTAENERLERRVLVMLQMAPEHYRPSGDYGGAGGYGDAAAALARRRQAARIARDNHLTLVDTWPMPILGIDCVIMQVPGDEPIQTVVDRLSHARGVAWSQPLNHFETRGVPQASATRAGTPNDKLFAAQPSALGWRLAELHRIATGRGVRVAVIDSMVDAGHPDLRGQLATVRNFVDGDPVSAEMHGTGVAGVIAAAENNGLGIAGVAPGARLLGLRACRQRNARSTVCDSLSIARALVYALENGAGVINMSLTGPSDQLVARLVQVGLRRNVSVVAAVDPSTGAGFPASIPGVIAVASDGVADTRAGVYNAPGRDVPTTEPGGRWNLVNGSSFAAAHVSGLLALARQLDSHHGARKLASSRTGGGTIDACATLLRAAEPVQRCRAGR